MNCNTHWKGILAALLLLTGAALTGCGSGQEDLLQEYSLSPEGAAETGAGSGDQESGEEASGSTGDMEGSVGSGDQGSSQGTGGQEASGSSGDEGNGEGGDSPETLYVYVCGEVREPGVYELEEGSRVYEAIGLAGGVTDKAAQEQLNQAREVVDGERIYVPSVQEVEEDPTLRWQGDTGSTSGSGESARVNINTAGMEELMTLSGIGESKARSILDYREEHGAFRSVEDLMQISGIKEGVFNKIKDEITI